MFGFLKKKRRRGRPSGFITTEETKKKISEGMKLAWQRRKGY